MPQDLLLAEEWALAVVGANFRGDRLFHDRGNLCIAGLVIAQLLVDGHAREGNRRSSVIRVDGGAPTSATLASALTVIEDHGPKITVILVEMLRSFPRTAQWPWDAALEGLVEAGAIARPGIGPYPSLIDPGWREAVLNRLHAAMSGDGPLESRDALLLGMTQAVGLLPLLGPEGKARHARSRSRHALDGSPFEAVAKATERLILMRSLAKGGAGT